MIPIEGSDEYKQTNEIKIASALLDRLDDIQGVTVSGKTSNELIFGITSKPSEQAAPEQVLETNRSHWVIENGCHYIIDAIYDEDRSQIRPGHGPVNITRMRRFAVGLLKSSGVKNITQKMRQMAHKVRIVFDYLRITKKYWPELSKEG